MSTRIFRRRPLRRSTAIVGIGGCLTLILLGWGVANSRRLAVWYHTRQMTIGWKEHHSQPEVRTGNLIGYTLGEPWKQYERSREALVELGEYRHAQYQFQVLRQGTADRRHYVRELMNYGSAATRETPPSIWWEMSEPPGGLSTMTIWGPSAEVEALLGDLKAHDVSDYGERFRKPSVLAEAHDYVQKWPTLGMWLPDSREVEFFRTNYDFTRDILRKEIHNGDRKIRGNALYVIRELVGTARDLGPDLVEMLAADPTGEPSLSVVRALTGIRFRSPECQAELKRQWDATASNPKIAITLAAAQSVLSGSSEERQRAEAYLIEWLQPVPDGLDPARRKAYLDTQLDVILSINFIPGFRAVEAPLERLLKNPAAFWMRTQIPYALEHIRKPVDEGL